MEITFSRRTKIIWLVTRIFIAVFFIAEVQEKLFLPFLNTTNTNITDPWTFWLDSGGRNDAFPYGLAMYAILAPIGIVANLIHAVFQALSVIKVSQCLIAILLICLEYNLINLSFKLSKRTSRINDFLIYSPLPLYITFIHGQIDLIPTVFILFMAYSLATRSWFKVGLFLGFGISAKFSLILILPFMIIYFLHSRGKKSDLIFFIKGIVPGLILFIIPVFWSEGYRKMVFGTPEILRSLNLAIDLGTIRIFLLPISYAFLFIWIWNLIRISPNMLSALTGIALFSVASMQIGSVGWFYWCIPLILPIVVLLSRRTAIFFLGWQTIICIFYIYRSENIVSRVGKVDWNASQNVTSLLFTIGMATGIAMIFKISTEMRRLLDVYGLSGNPITIAIAGDSGVGKDTLATGLSEMFGKSNTTLLHGDNYHLNERGDIFWIKNTHLGTESNDLLKWNRDIDRVIEGKAVSVSQYDHATGKFTASGAVEPADYVVLNGLHALLLPSSNKFDLKIYISMDEKLRAKFKFRRDTEERGHSDLQALGKGFIARKPDFIKYVKQQEELADLHFHIGSNDVDEDRLFCEVTTPKSGIANEIYPEISAIFAAGTSIAFSKHGKATITISSQAIAAEDLGVLIRETVPNYEQLIDPTASLRSGVEGFICAVSIIVLSLIRKQI